MTVERGRALFVSDHGVVPVSRGRGCLVHEGGGQLELAPGARARVAWPGRCSVDLVGPASLGWRTDAPGEPLRLDLVAVRAAELEVRQGGLRAGLPGAWRLDLDEGAYGLLELPTGGVQLDHQAGRVARATWVGGAGAAPPPAEVWPGQRVRLAGAPAGASRPDRGSAAPGWSTTGWPWGEAALGDPAAPIAAEPDSAPLEAPANGPALPPTGVELSLSPEAPLARVEVLGGVASERPLEPWRRWDWPWRPGPDLTGQEAPEGAEPLPDARGLQPDGALTPQPQITSPQITAPQTTTPKTTAPEPPPIGGRPGEPPASRAAADAPAGVTGAPGDSAPGWDWPWAPMSPATTDRPTDRSPSDQSPSDGSPADGSPADESAADGSRPDESRPDGARVEGPEVDPPQVEEAQVEQAQVDGHRPELWRGLPASALGRRPTCVVQLGVPFEEVERPDGGLELHLPADAAEPMWYFAPTLDLRLFPGASLVLEPDGSIRYHTGQVRFLQGHPERRF